MRKAWVDYAKGIGIVLVVHGHVLRGMNDAGLGSSSLLERADTLIYGFHMPLFFLLAGLFVGKWAERDFTTALKQKAYTILWPYLAWSLLQGSVSIVLSKATNASSLHWSNLWLKIAYLPSPKPVRPQLFPLLCRCPTASRKLAIRG